MAVCLLHFWYFFYKYNKCFIFPIFLFLKWQYKGIFGVVWSIIFWFVYENSPVDHKFISKSEQEYLLEETRELVLVASVIVR